MEKKWPSMKNSWVQGAFVLLTLFLLGSQIDWVAQINKNLGWVTVVGQLAGGGRDWPAGGQDGASLGGAAPEPFAYAKHISELVVRPDPVSPAAQWPDVPDDLRGMTHLWSLLHLCADSSRDAALSEERCQLAISGAGTSLLNHKMLPDLYQWNCHQIMDWLVLSDEVINTEQQIYWQGRLLKECSDLHVAYLAQNTNGQIQVALAYARLGMHDRAIAIGESAVRNQIGLGAIFLLPGYT